MPSFGNDDLFYKLYYNIIYNWDNYNFDIKCLKNCQFLSTNVWEFLSYIDICSFLKCSKDMQLFCISLNKIVKSKIFFSIKSDDFRSQTIYLHDMLFNFPNIYSLEFYSPFDYNLDNFLITKYVYNNTNLISSLKSLKIQIVDKKNLNNISKLINLEYLSLRYSSELTCFDLYKIKDFRMLKHLDLSYCSNITNEISLCDVMKYLLSVELLDISGTYLNGEIFFYLKECTNIKKIKICSSVHIRKYFTENIKYVDYLIFLDLSDTTIVDDDLVKLCNSLKNLEEFYFNNVKTIKDNKTLYHISKLINLRILSLESMECNNRFLMLLGENKVFKLESINLNDNKYIFGYDLKYLLVLPKLKKLYIADISAFEIKSYNILIKNNIEIFPEKTLLNLIDHSTYNILNFYNELHNKRHYYDNGDWYI